MTIGIVGLGLIGGSLQKHTVTTTNTRFLLITAVKK